MNCCDTCKHWKPTGIYFGLCPVLIGELEIELKTGWDGGYVESIETENTFGCTLHDPKQIPKLLKK